MLKLDDYSEFISPEMRGQILGRAKLLAGKKILMINSTNQGGGVAELLSSLVPLLGSVGVQTEWKVLTGSDSFFPVTKKIHNLLQVEKGVLSDDEKQIYLETNRMFAEQTDFSAYDLVVVHDPQPLPLVKFAGRRQPWILELHIDLTAPDPSMLQYVSLFTREYDEAVLSHEDFQKAEFLAPQRVFPPAIDPLSEKNRDLSPVEILASLHRHGVNVTKPIIAQVSRFDKWKDPLGVIRVFEQVRAKADSTLVLLGSFAADDPEGQKIYDEVKGYADHSPYARDIRVILVHDPVFTNALQRAARVVIQKSVREGFGLIVSEALFKGTPVVASNTGGIKLQIEHGRSGYLHDPSDLPAFARDILKIVKDENLRAA